MQVLLRMTQTNILLIGMRVAVARTQGRYEGSLEASGVKMQPGGLDL